MHMISKDSTQFYLKHTRYRVTIA